MGRVSEKIGAITVTDRGFAGDCTAGRWTWLPVTDRLVVSAAESLQVRRKRIAIRAAALAAMPVNPPTKERWP